MPYTSQASIDDRFRDGTTALWVACKACQCTNAPLQQCASTPLHLRTNAPMHPGGATGSAYAPMHPILHNAHQGGAIGCVEALLAARAKTTLMTSAGYSCLWIAAREGRTNIVQLLLDSMVKAPWLIAAEDAATHRSGSPALAQGGPLMTEAERRALAAWLPKRGCVGAPCLKSPMPRPPSI